MTSNAMMEATILEAAVEDYTGLWELVDELRPRLKGASKDDIVSAVAESLGHLIARGWVALYRGGEFSGEQVVVTPEEAQALLADKRNWQVPKDGRPHLRVGATSAGEQAYYSTKRTH